MPVDHAQSVPAGRPYTRPTLTALGTLADLTRGANENFTTDTIGSGTDSSGDDGSVVFN
ncbi:lasso RiPP family leader peptide-containing protein [Nakamurella flava]|uniref:Lasso RiPP family leader peptide-containing protein n=1 Tax=Nakamurella flava TaxID=2576308 RepID=A0A4U6QCZ9_9ACTN|nr:lasso RiPP family leader peptide-containing protein [Nakamurella flava]TKV57842.1 lasso RiPP family leader peptide-containing protein [Nakamurella flava]